MDLYVIDWIKPLNDIAIKYNRWVSTHNLSLPDSYQLCIGAYVITGVIMVLYIIKKLWR